MASRPYCGNIHLDDSGVRGLCTANAQRIGSRSFQADANTVVGNQEKNATC